MTAIAIPARPRLDGSTALALLCLAQSVLIPRRRRRGRRVARHPDGPRPPRIPPLEPPYDPEVEATLAKWMPPNSEIEPLKLFRTLALHPDLASRMRPLGAGILGHGLIDPREREVVIHRTCARCGAEYEWGVHVLAFGKPLGLTDEQIEATVVGDSGDPAWSDREALLIRLCDELHETDAVSDELWARLAETWRADQLLELVVTAGWYRLISYVINACGVRREPWAARFPETAGRAMDFQSPTYPHSHSGDSAA
jgi:4-carboxymuconolactone decarboxylase